MKKELLGLKHEVLPMYMTNAGEIKSFRLSYNSKCFLQNFSFKLVGHDATEIKQ